MFLKSKRGFTLVELMVVIAIIGILASIITASLGSAKANSRDARRISDLKNIQIALSLYYNDNTHYPGDIYAAAGSLSPNYISKVPKDPGNQSAYFYAGLTTGGLGSTCNNATRYHLGAVLEGGSQMNDDVDVSPIPSTIGGIIYNPCGLGSDFDGSSLTCGQTTDATDRCYDLINN